MTALRLPLSRDRGRRRPWARHRALRRISGDAQALLGVGLVLTSLVVAALGQGGSSDAWRLVGISCEFLAAQALAALAAPYLRPTAGQRLMISVARFALAILYVSVVTSLLRTGDFRPTAVLFI